MLNYILISRLFAAGPRIPRMENILSWAYSQRHSETKDKSAASEWTVAATSTVSICFSSQNSPCCWQHLLSPGGCILQIGVG